MATANNTLEDELSNPSVEEEEDEEEEESEDEEPIFNYKRFSEDLVKGLGPPKDANLQNFRGIAVELISCIAVHMRFIIVGMDSGRIVVLDADGNKLPGREYSSHTSPIVSITIDDSGENIASCSQDGKIIILNLLNPQHTVTLNQNKQVLAVEFAPNFSKLKSPIYITGSDELVLFEERSKPFGRKKTVLHGGEGSISTIKWRGTFIAWANRKGMYIYDNVLKRIIGIVSRESQNPNPKLAPCHLVWKNETEIVIGWADRVKVGIVQTTRALHSSEFTRDLIIVQNIQLDLGIVAGVAPFVYEGDSNHLVVLQYVLSDEKDKEIGIPSGKREPPQLVVLKPNPTSDSPDEICRDSLPVRGYQIYHCCDYMFATDVDSERLYAVAPMDMILIQRRTIAEKVQWQLDHKNYETAYEMCDNFQKELKDTPYRTELIGQEYVTQLLNVGDFSEAARVCVSTYNRPSIKEEDRKILWQNVVIGFLDKGAAAEIWTFIPTSKPTLDPTVYERVLFTLLDTSPEVLCSLVRLWPADIFNIEAILICVENRLKENANHEILLRVKAELYAQEKKFDKAIEAYFRLNHPEVFSMIKRHKLYSPMLEHLGRLLNMSEEETVDTLLVMRDEIEPTKVVDMLDKLEIEKERREYYVHCYLDALFKLDEKLAPQYHSRQVELYARFAPDKLKSFLQTCNNVPIKEALAVCDRFGLIDCKVYLLRRMGNYKEAIKLTLEKGRHTLRQNIAERCMKDAILIAREQNDDELWMELVNAAKDHALFTKILLKEAGTNIDAIKLIKEVKVTKDIAGLKDTVITLLQSYALKKSLREGCRTILNKDCQALMNRYYGMANKAYVIENDSGCVLCENDISRTHQSGVGAKYVVFSCGHVYHLRCIQREGQSDIFCMSCPARGILKRKMPRTK